MRLENFISDLLYEHDCVVVPGFGGLVANYRSAKLNKQTHLIFPPSKYVGFNRHLKNNDGLLITHLSGLLNISYKDAQEKVSAAVQEWQSALQRDGRVFWERIGTFFYDKSGSLQFIPEEQENYLLSSFGLRPVQLTPVIVQVSEENKVIPIEEAKPQKRSTTIAWRVAAVVAVPLLFAGIWMASNKSNLENINLASLNPFHTEKIKANYSPDYTTSIKELNWQRAESPLENYLNDTTNKEEVRFDFEHLTFSEDGILIAKNKPAVADKTSKADGKGAAEAKKCIAKGRYAVIGGAFADQQNAERFLDKLKQNGFEASFAGKRGGLQLVAYGFYDSATEAQNAMANIRSSGTGSAWIKRY